MNAPPAAWLRAWLPATLIAIAACDNVATTPTEPIGFQPIQVAANGSAFVTGDGAHLVCPAEAALAGASVPISFGAVAGFFSVRTTGSPLITLNFARLRPLPSAVQAFLFFRACGHVNFDVLSDIPVGGIELAANCFSARRIRRLRLFTPHDWILLRQFLIDTFPVPREGLPSGLDQFRQLQLAVCF